MRFQARAHWSKLNDRQSELIVTDSEIEVQVTSRIRDAVRAAIDKIGRKDFASISGMEADRLDQLLSSDDCHHKGRTDAAVLQGAPGHFIKQAVSEMEGSVPDAVHAHGHWYTLRAALKYKKRHPETTVVFTLHTEFSQRLWFLRRWMRRLLCKADFLTAVSADLLARTLKTYRPSTRTRVIFPGFVYRPVERSRVETFLKTTGLESAKPLIAFMGPLACQRKSQGVEVLIQAIRILRKRYPDAALVVVGDGMYRGSLEDLVAKVVPGSVVFLGTVDDRSPVLAAADVYAHISFQEGLPYSILESMAHGKAVVATRVGGIPEIIEGGRNANSYQSLRHNFHTAWNSTSQSLRR